MQKFKLKTKTKQFWYKYYKRRIEPANENSSVQKWLEDKRTKCFSSLTLKSKQHALHERPLLMIHG